MAEWLSQYTCTCGASQTLLLATGHRNTFKLGCHNLQSTITIFNTGTVTKNINNKNINKKFHFIYLCVRVYMYSYIYILLYRTTGSTYIPLYTYLYLHLYVLKNQKNLKMERSCSYIFYNMSCTLEAFFV